MIRLSSFRFSKLKELNLLLIILTAILAALLFVYLFGATTYDFDGVELTLSTRLASQGRTILDLPPFGSMAAATHAQVPFELIIKLDYIGTEFAQSFLNSDAEISEDIINNLKMGIPTLFLPFALKQVFLAALGGFLGVWLIWRSPFLLALAAAFLGGITIIIMLFGCLQVYDISTFEEPEYNGVLALAPNLIPTPDELLDRLELVQHQTRRVAGNIQTLFTNANGISTLTNPEDDKQIRKILLVGDLHSNPIGVEFLKSLADNFKVDIIVDTGDLTDFGNSLETKMTEGLLQIDIPYVFVPGNHDTPEVVDFVKEMKNSLVLQGQNITIKGISFKGAPDSLANSKEEFFIDDRSEWEKLINEQVENLSVDEYDKENLPDILVVHNHEVAQKLSQDYPLVVNGHTHRVEIVENLDHIRINPGTAGAAGLRGLYSESSIPYSAVILYIKPGERPVAADIIKYEPLSDHFFLERKLFKN